ncbi:MAG TPA: YigZ family protein [Pseudomonas sp.]|nr:YigZ family protein [Pseudomonas sp.]
MTWTLTASCDYQEDIRKSRFLALAAPIRDAADAQRFLSDHSAPDATHNCWAWKIGQQYRFNDDGEPGGTAGRPILAAIEGQGFDQVVVLVIRWYGGILLGTGGLARAYGGCAAKCLRAGSRERMVARIALRCHCAFAEHALVRQRLLEVEAVIDEERYLADGVAMMFQLAPERRERLQQQLADLSRGRLVLHET